MRMKHLVYAISALSAFTGMIVNDDFWAKNMVTERHVMDSGSMDKR